jgi:hypothetical protein
MRRVILFLIILFPLIGKSQVTSVASGAWEDPLIWDCGCVPFPGIGTITISTNHTVTISSTINANTIKVQAEGVLTINSGGRLILAINLTIDPADPFGAPQTSIDGLVNVSNGGILENKGLISSVSNMIVFANGSEYQHNQNDGTIAYATWQAGSTCRITGWLGSNTPSGPFKSSLSQNFHHFIWDSPNQTAPNVQLTAALTTVNGDLIINNTSLGNNNRQLVLGFSLPGTGTLSVGGNFIVNANARVNISATGTYTVNVAGNCVFSSTLGAAAPQYNINSSSGTTNLNVAGDFTINSGQANLSTNLGTGNFNIGGNLNLNGGVIAKPGSGTGNVTFTGAVNHTITKVSGTFSGGNLTVQSGTLNVSGNPLSLAGDISIASGATFNLPATISTAGNINFVSGSTINSNNGSVTLTGSVPQTINANGATLNNLSLNKGIDGITVSLTSPLSLSGELTISSSVAGSVFNAGTFPNNLTLLSTSDAATGNARIGSLSNGANVTGNVTVQRFMSPEGRVYRYISSPVNAPVSQLQTYFPITGTFTGNNNGGCTGCSSVSSMFFYDATLGAGQYAQFPVSANTELLIPGRGYAAFIRQDVLAMPGSPVTFNLTGPINQGDIPLPVFHNASPSESWNLVGNPYPSSIDWDDASWTKTNVAVPIAVRDAGAGIFQYWDGNNGGITNGVIASGQGFWVRTTAASPQLTVRETAKSATAGEFFREAGSEVISMTLTKGSLYDRAYFKLRNDAQHGLDEFDAPKLVNDNFDFSTRFDDTSPFAINSINELACGTELFLDLRFTKKADNSYVINPEGNYELAFEIAGYEFQNFEIVLEDQFTGTQLPVVSGFNYSFTITSDPVSMSNERLKLKFGELPPQPEVFSAERCKEGTVVLTASGAPANSTYTWFENLTASEPLATGNDFLTPNLYASKSYFVSVKNPNGCESIRVEAKAIINQYDDAKITVERGNVLMSNYETGNQWFFNTEILVGETAKSITVSESGNYSVAVSVGECSAMANIDYVVTGIEGSESLVKIYPNPFKDKIYVDTRFLKYQLSQISLINSLGQEVSNQSQLIKEGENLAYFSLGNVSDGIYFVKISLPEGIKVVKVIKDSK